MTFCINDCKVIMVFKRRRLRMMNDIARFHQSKSALCPPFITCPRVIPTDVHISRHLPEINGTASLLLLFDQFKVSRI